MAIVLRTPTPIGHREHRGGTQEHEMFGGIRCSPAGTSAFHIGVCRLDSSIPADRTLMSEDALDSLSGCRDRYTPPTERVCADSGTQTSPTSSDAYERSSGPSCLYRSPHR